MNTKAKIFYCIFVAIMLLAISGNHFWWSIETSCYLFALSLVFAFISYKANAPERNRVVSPIDHRPVIIESLEQSPEDAIEPPETPKVLTREEELAEAIEIYEKPIPWDWDYLNEEGKQRYSNRLNERQETLLNEESTKLITSFKEWINSENIIAPLVTLVKNVFNWDGEFIKTKPQHKGSFCVYTDSIFKLSIESDGSYSLVFFQGYLCKEELITNAKAALNKLLKDGLENPSLFMYFLSPNVLDILKGIGLNDKSKYNPMVVNSFFADLVLAYDISYEELETGSLGLPITFVKSDSSIGALVKGSPFADEYSSLFLAYTGILETTPEAYEKLPYISFVFYMYYLFYVLERIGFRKGLLLNAPVNPIVLFHDKAFHNELSWTPLSDAASQRAGYRLPPHAQAR